MKKLGAWASAVMVGLAVSAAPASAGNITLDFAFDGVSGTFYGLRDDLTSEQSVTSFDFKGVLDEYPGVPNFLFSTNVFRFDATGALASVGFFAPLTSGGPLGINGTGYLLSLSCTLSTCSSIEAETLDNPTSFARTGTLPVTYRIVSTDMTPVPLPAGGLLLLTGLFGVAATYGRKARKT